MIAPTHNDYIDIHTHGLSANHEVFAVSNIVIGKDDLDTLDDGSLYSVGIHPWYLCESNLETDLAVVRQVAERKNVIAIGETGFDKLRGAPMELQLSSFEKHVALANELNKPVVVHCVKGWGELLNAHKRLNPQTPWMIHGFHGNDKLAAQLVARGIYLSVWCKSAIHPESGEPLIRHIPKDRLFLETDGMDVDIRDIYDKVAGYLAVSVDDLKSALYENYCRCFMSSKR